MKYFKKFTSILCGAAVMFSFFTAFSIIPAAAASAPSITMRVEGQKATLYSGTVGFTEGDNFYDIMAAALAAKDIGLVSNDGAYGHEIVSVGGESGAYPVWWHLYVNGKASDVGADSLIPSDGDDIVLYLGDDSVVLYPTVTLSPEYPVEGRQTTVNVSASYVDYSDYANPVTKTVEISGVTVTFNGNTYNTDSDGNAVITMPAAGGYTITAVKETKDTTQAIVRTGGIPVTVYTADTVPSDGTSSGDTSPDSGKVTGDATQRAVTSKDIDTAIKSGADYILASGITDWGAALAYSAAGGSVPQSYFDSVAEDIASGGTALPTHLAGVIIGLKASGANPRSFNGSDLVAQLYTSDNLGKSGLNGYTYGLLAFDCGNYTLPEDAAVSREKIIDGILSYQQDGGAFSLDKNTAPDCDMTAIAVTALAPYISEGKVKTAVDAAVSYLSKAQQPDGGYLPSYSSSESSESTAQVVIALSSIGVDSKSDTRFIKNGNSPVSALMAYKKADGGFAHTQDGSSDLMATEQAVTALAALKSFQNGGVGVYNLTAAKSVAVTTKTGNPHTGDGGDAGNAMLIISAAALAAFAALRAAARSGSRADK